MNLFDMLVIAILAYCVIRGIFRGLIKEMSALIGVLAGFYFAYSYYMWVARPLLQWTAVAKYANIISFLAIFCLAFLVVSIIGMVIRYVLNISFMGWFDRVCGGIFGTLKGLMIISILFIVFTAFLRPGTALIKQSLLAPHVAIVSEKMAKVISPDMKRQFKSKIKELKKYW